MENQHNLPVTPISIVFSTDHTGDEKTSESNKVDGRASSREQDYEPYDHGKDKNPLHYYAALFHIIKYTVGSGILAIPYTFQNVGYLVGVAGTLLLGLIYLHSLHILLAIEYELCQRLKTTGLTYLSLVDYTFKGVPRGTLNIAPLCKFMVFFNFIINSVLYNSGYLIVMGGNLKNLYDGYYNSDIDIKQVITVLVVPLTFLCWIPKLRFLTPLSLMTSAFICVNVVIIIAEPTQQGFVDGHPKPVNNIFFFPQFFGMVLSAAAVSGMIFPVKNDMGKPRSFGSSVGVLNVSVVLTTILYAAFGCLCYLKYGDTVQGNVLLNLQKGQVLSTVVYTLYTLALCVSFILNFYVVFDITFRNGWLGEAVLRSNLPGKFCFKYGYKTLVNVITYIIAIVIPNFELFVSLTGTVGILIELCLPSTLQIVMYSSSLERKNKRLTFVKNLAIITIAVILFATGFYGSVRDIIKFYDG